MKTCRASQPKWRLRRPLFLMRCCRLGTTVQSMQHRHVWTCRCVQKVTAVVARTRASRRECGYVSCICRHVKAGSARSCWYAHGACLLQQRLRELDQFMAISRLPEAHDIIEKQKRLQVRCRLCTCAVICLLTGFGPAGQCSPSLVYWRTFTTKASPPRPCQRSQPPTRRAYSICVCRSPSTGGEFRRRLERSASPFVKDELPPWFE